MFQCPLCHAAVKDDFGLLECPGCGAQLIVHMDGRVEYQGAKENTLVREEPSPTESFEPGEPMREIEFDQIEEPKSREADDLVPPGKTGAAYRMPEDDLYASPDEPPAIPAKSIAGEDGAKEFLGAEGGQDESDFVDDDDGDNDIAAPATAAPEALPDFDGSEEQGPAPVAYNAAPVSSSPDLRDVANFGNSEISGGREGPLRYNLFIEGIDTVDVRESFREALTDRKLMWDTDQILRSVRNGCVNIPNVAPTKAYILITRLRGMPVQVRWEQYAISQT